MNLSDIIQTIIGIGAGDAYRTRFGRALVPGQVSLSDTVRTSTGSGAGELILLASPAREASLARQA